MMHLCTLYTYSCAYLFERSVHQVNEADGEGREEVEELAHKVSLRPHDGEGHDALAEVQLLGQDLLDVLGPLHGEAPVRHHEVNASAVAVFKHESLQLFDVFRPEMRFLNKTIEFKKCLFSLLCPNKKKEKFQLINYKVSLINSLIKKKIYLLLFVLKILYLKTLPSPLTPSTPQQGSNPSGGPAQKSSSLKSCFPSRSVKPQP